MHRGSRVIATQTPQRRLLLAILLLLVVAGGTALANTFILQNMPWNDVIPRYEGCRAFLTGESPYTEEVTARIQTHLLEFTGDEQRFAYPAHLCLVLLPIWVLPYELAASLWFFCLFAFMMALPLLVFHYTMNTPLTPLQFGVLALVTLLGYRYSMMTIVLGQYSGLVLMGLVGATWGLARGRTVPLWLGLTAMTIRPEGMIMAAALAGGAFLRDQRRAVITWAGIMVALWLGTHLFIGAWEGQFLAGMVAYAGYNPGVQQWLPLLAGRAGAGVIALGVSVWVAVMLRWLWGQSTGSFWMGASVVVATAGQILIPQTNPYTLIYLLPGFYYVLQAFRTRRWTWFPLLALMILPWWFLVQGRAVAHIDQLLFPLALAILTVAARRWGEPPSA